MKGFLDIKLAFPSWATWCEELTHLKRPWCRERLRAGGEGDGRGWDGWMASPTRWTWVWVNSRSWMDREASCAAVHGVAKSRTQLSGWTELNCEARDFSGKNVEWVAIPFSGASAQPRYRTQASRASSNAGWPLRCWAKGKPNIWYKSEVKVTVTQLCLTICEPMAYTVHGILQARTLEWVAVPFSRGSSQPRDRTQVSCIAGGFFTSWATREAKYLIH